MVVLCQPTRLLKCMEGVITRVITSAGRSSLWVNPVVQVCALTHTVTHKLSCINNKHISWCVRLTIWQPSKFCCHLELVDAPLSVRKHGARARKTTTIKYLVMQRENLPLFAVAKPQPVSDPG